MAKTPDGLTDTEFVSMLVGLIIGLSLNDLKLIPRLKDEVEAIEEGIRDGGPFSLHLGFFHFSKIGPQFQIICKDGDSNTPRMGLEPSNVFCLVADLSVHEVTEFFYEHGVIDRSREYSTPRARRSHVPQHRVQKRRR